MTTRVKPASKASPRYFPLPVRMIHCKFCDVACTNAVQMQDHLNREHAGWIDHVFKMMQPPEQ